ncbi:hypothetical protein Hanom_Chr00s000003g01601491 [Helianthus anomalus]
MQDAFEVILASPFNQNDRSTQPLAGSSGPRAATTRPLLSKTSSQVTANKLPLLWVKETRIYPVYLARTLRKMS